MIEMKQATIKKPINCSGIGLHTGANITMSLLPAPANSGIIFKRTDVPEEISIVEAIYHNVEKTTLCTSITNKHGVEINTIEHLMSALWASRVDNIFIEINGPELPSMDGSADQFLFLIECAGIENLDASINVIEVSNKIEIVDKDAKITFLPSDHFSIEMKIDFKDAAIGVQNFTFSEHHNSFKKDISRARTFGFFDEIAFLQTQGLAKGGSLDNAIVVKNGKILNQDGLRYENEFVRHKILDCIGDLYLAGGFLKAKIIAEKTGHFINNLALRKLFAQKLYKITNFS
jgi:UDP-3-O-[3-hydroxymyristoyl] N-acetylglucosamine deacetylase